jgi:hypothetical protein
MDSKFLGELIRTTTDRRLVAEWGMSAADARQVQDTGADQPDRWVGIDRPSALHGLFNGIVNGIGGMVRPAQV